MTVQLNKDCRVHALCSVALCDSSEDLVNSLLPLGSFATDGASMNYPSCSYDSGRRLGEEEVRHTLSPQMIALQLSQPTDDRKRQ